MTKIHLLLAEIQFCKSAVCDVIRCTVIVKNIPTLVLVSASGITPPRGSKTYFLNQISKTTPQDSGIKKGPEMAKILNLYLCDDARNLFNHDHWDCKIFTLKRRRRKKKSFINSVFFVFFSLRYSSHWSDIPHSNSTTLMNTLGGATHSEHSLPSHPHSWLHCGCCMPWELLQEH